MKNTPSPAVINRLPRYYRFLSDLKEQGLTRISSKELSTRMSLTASQIRQDLNCFGGFGQQGYGYNIPELHSEIAKILGIENSYKAILLGAGNLGRAIATQINFEKRGFSLIGIFDAKESVAGQMITGIPVRHITGLDEFCRINKPDTAILCIPKSEAASVVQQLINFGIKGFWNFSHYDIASKYPDVPVENVHLSDSLMTFCYKMTEFE